SRTKASVRSRSATSSGESVKSIITDTLRMLVHGVAKRSDSSLGTPLAACMALLRLAAELLAQPLSHRLRAFAGIELRLGHRLFHHVVANLHLAHDADVPEPVMWRRFSRSTSRLAGGCIRDTRAPRYCRRLLLRKGPFRREGPHGHAGRGSWLGH